VNVWLVAATTLLVALVPCGWVVLRGRLTDALVLLAEGFHRSSYFVLPLVLGGLSFVGSLVFIRFLGDRWL
jgi:multisubunit Na+/H+ antiporter MnhF subunit